MKNINIQLFEGNDIVTLKSDDLFKNKRVLICSIHYPHTKVTHLYLRHLSECYEIYKRNQVDEIYVIDSHDDYWSLAVVGSFFPKLKIILDHDKQFISFLKDKFEKEEDTEFLSKNWIYQILSNNLKIEQFYDQPTKNRMDNFKEWLKENPERLDIKFNKDYMIKPEELTFNTRSNSNNTIFFYYNIWPNKKLEEYLRTN